MIKPIGRIRQTKYPPIEKLIIRDIANRNTVTVTINEPALDIVLFKSIYSLLKN
jgi:hypothetical protein